MLANSHNFIGKIIHNYILTNLGIVLHYITDYFCYPHNDSKADKMPYHIFYEISLDKELRRYIISSAWKQGTNLEIKDSVSFGASLIDLIEDKHKQYLNELPSLLNDVTYGIQVCCIAATEIINCVASMAV